jgi:hypothetical protein
MRKEYYEKYYQENKERLKEYSKEYHKENKERRNESSKDYYENNKEYNNDRSKKYYDNNRGKRLEQCKENNKNNKERNKIRNKKWREETKEKRKQYKKEKNKTDPIYRLKELTRKRIVNALKSQSVKKSNKNIKYLGCNKDFYKEYLEKQFDKHMSWQNHGTYWVIDHIIPLSFYDLTNESEQIQAFNWHNTRPLEKNKNLEKTDKIEVYTSEGTFLV